MKRDFSNVKRMVVKVGSSTLTHESGLLNIRRVEKLVKVLSDVKNSGVEIVLVSSGAQAVGVGKLSMGKKPQDMPGKQAVAAVGQCELMYIYDKLFSEYHHVTAQILMTKDILGKDISRRNVENTFRRLLAMHCLPIVNENDSIATEEIEFGDNDTLSAVVAVLCQADLLAILSDIDGLYDSDPHTNPNAKLYSVAPEITAQLESQASGAGTARGTGGMSTKLAAAQIALHYGIEMAILNGADPNNLYRLLEGQNVGTYFPLPEHRS